MKNNYETNRHQLQSLSVMVSLFLLTLFSINEAKAQCSGAPPYCTNIVATNNANYNMGFQNISFGYGPSSFMINNSSMSPGGNGTQIYYDLTNLVDTAYAGSTIYWSIKVGSGNLTTFRIFIDWNQDGTFGTTSPELVYTSASGVAAGTIVTGNFVVPVSTAGGIYRIRCASDYNTAPAPCGPITYSAQFADFTLIVPGASVDVVSNKIVTPVQFANGNNSLSFKFYNISSTTITSIGINYQLDANSVVSEPLTGLSIAPGAAYTASFATTLVLPGIGSYNLKIWPDGPNGGGNASPQNDTLCKNINIVCAGPLAAGTYTIDPAGSGSSNFKSFGAADSVISICGILGPVVFQVAPGTYVEQVDIKPVSAISPSVGSSATNTVTFDGGSAATTIIQYSTASSSDAHTVRFNGCSYINFQNMTIKALGTTNGIGVHVLGAATFINLKHDSIIVAPNSTQLGVKAIYINNSTSAGANYYNGTGAAVHDINIDSNYISGGNFGIYMTSSYTTAQTNPLINIRRNTIENVYQYGLHSYSFSGYNISNNSIKMSAGNSGSYGLYLYVPAGSYKSYVIGNTWENCGYYGIYTVSSGWNSGSIFAYNYFKPTFSNTGTGLNGPAAIGFTYTSGLLIYNNTIRMNKPEGRGITNYSTGGPVTGYNNNDIRNNLVILDSAAAAGPAIQTGSGTTSACDYNTCFTYNAAIPALAIVNGNPYTKTTFIGGGGFNTHSFIDNPLLTGLPANILPHAICQKGIATTPINVPGTGNGVVTTDIYGVPFSNPPQIGASEAGGGFAVDASLKSFILPAAYPVSAGLQDVAVRVKNSGTTTITSFSVSVQLGATTNTIFWTGSLVPCTDTLITFTGANQFTLVTGSNTLKAWTSDPNFVVDSNPYNDTLVNTFCTTLLTGTYLIDSAGNGDYLSFTQVANVLSCGGINGPVVFNVRKGTYVEQPMFLTVLGGSAANSVTFKSEAGHADSVLLQFNSTSSTSNWVLNLNGASFFKFRNMTISALNANNGIAMTFGNNATSDTFYNVVFKGTSSASNTTNRALVSQPSQTNISNYMCFDTCRFINGAFGTYINSSSNNAIGQSSQNLCINNCDFINQYAYAIYNQYVCGLKLTKNRISTNSTYNNYYGMYNYWVMSLASTNKPVITGNTITGSAGGVGMYNFYFGVNSTVTATNRSLIANNVINIGSGSNATYGIMDGYSSGCDYVNNTVKIGTSSTTNTSAAFYDQTTCCYYLNSVINNVFAGTNGAPAVSLYDATFTPVFNYNNLFTTGPNLAYLNTTSKSNLAAWRTSSNRDANSISYLPGFTSNTDLTPNPSDTASWSLNGRANFTNLITTDILGNARPLVVANGVPDIGAYEFTPTSTAPMCTSNLAAATAGTTQYFFFSLDTVASIAWDPSYPTPDTIKVRQYSGVPPQHIAPATNYMYFYTDVTGTSGFYSYTMNLKYRNTWMGTMSSAANLRMATYSPSSFPNWTSWTTGTNPSSVNTSTNTITNVNTGDLVLFTASDTTSALPVTLFDVSANRVRNDVVVNWSTASEKNSSMFEIERSFDGNQFAAVGKVKAAGNSNAFVSYSFSDRNAVSLTSGNVMYYRLKMVDMDGKFEYSKTVTVRLNSSLNDVTVVMYPNPVFNKLYVKVNLPVSGNVKIELMDITGKTLMSKTQWMEAGSNVSSENLGNLSSGLYFLSTEINGEKQVQKLIKE